MITGLFFWGDSFSDGISFSGSGKGAIILMPLVILGMLWELVFLPEGSVTFAFIFISFFFYYIAFYYHKKQINHVEIVEGPPRYVLSKEQLRSNLWGTAISFLIFTFCVLSPVIFVLLFT